MAVADSLPGLSKTSRGAQAFKAVCVCVCAFILLFWEQNYLYRTLVVWKGVFAVVVCYLLDLKLGQRLWSSVCALVSANVSVCAPALGELSFVEN